MAAKRTEIFDALLARMRGIQMVRTCSERLKSWDDVSPAEQPAIFVVPSDENGQSQMRGTPTVWTLRYKLYVYARVDDPLASGARILHKLLSEIEDALVATDEERAAASPTAYDTTLGGLCQHVRISGTVVKDEGALGEQAVAVVPLEILTTAA